ncbi:phosphoribosylanthranilate isomerase [Halopenitus malekzadehii]|uniref:N-(5'-phosphoribosyl)anthranilate isomerase n=1 Tax=Halopenitus malekzadehii TaxID=1267564 RepID=A0A1H6IXC8_9EURY|nr:phosphoribosylanthranilate isomerase [Halopenitus malekzadehii]SEH51734.1 phosphoribosylanthranilate isomerase [Halopenitus malekzadehii]
MARAKVCGLTRGADVRATIEAGADAVGAITEVPVDTPREVDPATAADLLAGVPPFVTATLVTMPDSPERAVELVRTVGPDALQLHGEWTPEEIGYVRAETGVKVLVTVDADEHALAERLDEAVDALVVDSTTEEGAGGTGRTHDWEATGSLATRLTSPVVLAGGLDPENVAEAVETADPYAVDVASGVELSGGRKDHNALARFVRNAGREVTLA